MGSEPKFACRFEVRWGDECIGFHELTGLSIDRRYAEYRDGSDSERSARKLAGINKYSIVTLKRGSVPGTYDFYRWLRSCSTKEREPRDVMISVLDEERGRESTWVLRSAFPVRIDETALNSVGNDVAIEMIELSHEGIDLVTDEGHRSSS